MSDYAFVHDGRAFTPNGTTVDVSAVEDHNNAIEAEELRHWQTQPDHMLGYYKFPAESLLLFGRPRSWRAAFNPVLHTYTNQETPNSPGVAHQATVTTWRGITIGTITSAHVYTHNFGGRFVSLTVRGTNGATYYGRASWDNGTCINLRKRKG